MKDGLVREGSRARARRQPIRPGCCRDDRLGARKPPVLTKSLASGRLKFWSSPETRVSVRLLWTTAASGESRPRIGGSADSGPRDYRRGYRAATTLVRGWARQAGETCRWLTCL